MVDLWLSNTKLIQLYNVRWYNVPVVGFDLKKFAALNFHVGITPSHTCIEKKNYIKYKKTFDVCTIRNSETSIESPEMLE